MYWNQAIYSSAPQEYRLTLTWDVLKCRALHSQRVKILININMRCIEIEKIFELCSHSFGLTLTWDVLKWHCFLPYYVAAIGLTLTWDVLKSSYTFTLMKNGRRLTLTWDVLK